jgi:hypothetical protein
MEKAHNVLSFNPRYTVKDIVKNLAENVDKFKDVENPNYYNIKVFKMMDESKR